MAVVTTRVDIDVCTAHLATRSTIEAAGNEGQCAELAGSTGLRSPSVQVLPATHTDHDALLIHSRPIALPRRIG